MRLWSLLTFLPMRGYVGPHALTEAIPTISDDTLRFSDASDRNLGHFALEMIV